MEDILETALFDAGISLEPSSSNNNGTEMQSPPKLQKMEEHSEPTPSNQIPRTFAGTNVMSQQRSNSSGILNQTPRPQQRTVVMSNGRKFVVITPQNNAVHKRLPIQVPAQTYIPNSKGVPYKGSFAVKRNPVPPIKVIRPIMQSQQLPSPRTSQQILARRPVNLPTKPQQSMVSPQNRQKRPVISNSKHDNQHNEDLEEDEKLIQVDTFIEYTPLKLRSGLRHPDPVVETASLSSVAAPEILYHMTIPEEIIDSGKISALQLEAALYACQAHEKKLPSGERVGYLIGDGAGVGKGRTIATVIYENYLLGRRRAIWISVSTDLYYDAKRDLRDIGATEIDVYSLSKMKYAKINSPTNGNIKKGVVFLTYHALVGDRKNKESDPNFIQSRLQQLIQWFGVEYDGLIVFDECHHAKNLTAAGTGTKAGRCVLNLQKSLPNARIIYASATGATVPGDMSYMTRLGLWGDGQTFPDFGSFLNAVENKGIGCIELIGIDMKLRGLYLARQLSFKGVDFSIRETPLSAEFIHMYDESVKLWIEARRQFQYAIEHTRNNEKSPNRIWSHFWAAHQRFFKYLCIGAKVEECVKIAREALEEGKCVVIGLQSTGESHTKKALEEDGEITDFVSSTKAVLQTLIEKHFPIGDGGSLDIYEDLGRMSSFGQGGHFVNGRKRHLDDIEISNTKRRHRNSTGSPNEDEQSTDNENSDTDDSSNSDEDSDFNDSEGSESEIGVIKTNNNDKSTDNLFQTLMCELDNAPDHEVDPFHHDFSSAVDPWAHLQTEHEEILSPEEKRELEEEKRKKRRHRRKLRQEKREKELKQAAIRQHDEQLKWQREKQMNYVRASDFMESTRVIDNDPETGDTISLPTIKVELLSAVERLGKKLPPNTLDELIDALGGPSFVAEMTGRKGRVVVLPNGQTEYQLRNADSEAAVEKMNMEEKEKFMNGEKLVAVISEAASSGISLQSDKRVGNKRRRVHMTLELPWSADKAVQQFGRTHRSNQVNAPEYVFLISELAGENRFASTVAKRLESLGALTHGDRRAAETRDLSKFNLDNKYGRDALSELIKTLSNPDVKPVIPAPSEYKLGEDKFFEDMREYLVGVGVLSVNKSNPNKFTAEKDASTLSKFLNRLLGLPVYAQNMLFSYFTNIINELIRRAKANGTFDKGIMDLGSGSDQAQKIENRVFRGFAGNPNFVVEIHKIGAERGINWQNAKSMYDAQSDSSCGFYLSNPVPERKQTIVLVINTGKNSSRNFCFVRPNTGRSPKTMAITEIVEKFKKITLEEAELNWNQQYEVFANMCLHRFVNGSCKKEESHEFCEFGRRQRTYFVLTGSVVAVWPILEKALEESVPKFQSTYMQIVRIRTDDNSKLVGLLVVPRLVKPVLSELARMSNNHN